MMERLQTLVLKLAQLHMCEAKVQVCPQTRKIGKSPLHCTAEFLVEATCVCVGCTHFFLFEGEVELLLYTHVVGKA